MNGVNNLPLRFFTRALSAGTLNGSLKFSTSTTIAACAGTTAARGFTKWLATPASSANGSSSLAEAAIHIQ